MISQPLVYTHHSGYGDLKWGTIGPIMAVVFSDLKPSIVLGRGQSVLATGSLTAILNNKIVMEDGFVDL